MAVRALGDAYEGISLAEIARAFGALARIAHEIADELEGRLRPRADPRLTPSDALTRPSRRTSDARAPPPGPGGAADRGCLLAVCWSVGPRRERAGVEPE